MIHLYEIKVFKLTVVGKLFLECCIYFNTSLCA